MNRIDLNGRRQRGAALMLFMLIVIVAAAAVLVSGLTRDALAVQDQTDTRELLAIARQSLLDYALLRTDRGDGLDAGLPCPDIDDSGGFADGIAHETACGAPGVAVIGRLPWRTLQLPALKDSSSACLWYVVSGSWKDAAGQTAELLNADSNGHLQLFNVESATMVTGTAPEDRPVAMVFAAMRPLPGQARPAATAGRQCAPGATPLSYLDSDPGSGISNASLSGSADTLESFATAAGYLEGHNDRAAVITGNDINAYLRRRQDRANHVRELGLAAAACIANYAATNPGGSNDLRMPWPTTVALSDYRTDAAYDDVNSGFVSGRLADTVDDSNANTGNTLARVLLDCDPLAVPAWTAAMATRWSHWKDHFFYAVAPSFAPDAPTPSSCGSCLTVNGSGQYAAVLIFGGDRLSGQQRNEPPLDSDTKRLVGSYLEAGNGTSVPGVGTDFASATATPVFNDRLFCIDATLAVSEC